MDLCYEEEGEIAAFIRGVCGRGVRLWSQQGQLHYKAAKGVLTRTELAKLKSSRDQILALLSAPGGDRTEQRREPEARFYRVPLTFPQLAHWRLFRLSNCCISPQITSVLQLRGTLHTDLLEQSLDYLTRRHDALRTRIVSADGAPEQEVDRVGTFELRLEDLASVPEDRRSAEVTRVIQRKLGEPTDFGSGPLFSGTLLKFSAADHVLIVTMDHMVCDAFSMEMLLREAFDAYSQVVKRAPFSFRAVAVQYSDYALWQVGRQDHWLQAHGSYWSARLDGCGRVRFPIDKQPVPQRPVGLSCVPIDLGSSLTDGLREWSRQNCTTLTLSVLTAYLALALRWCSASEMVVQYQTAGRSDPKLDNTIGYLAAVLYLRIEMLDGDTFVDLLQRITREYYSADEHADSSYIASRSPRPEFGRNTIFNWVPRSNGLGWKVLGNTSEEIEITRVEFDDPGLQSLECDHEPAIVLSETDDSIVGGIYFPKELFSTEAMNRFAVNLVAFTQEMTSNPGSHIGEIEVL
jgi:hypothetical protein